MRKTDTLERQVGYTFEDKPHHYLPDVVGTLTDGKPFIAEAGMEDDKREDRNLAKAEAARRLARLQRGVFWIGTVGESAAQGHLLVDLEQFALSRTLPLALLPPDAPPLVPSPLPDTLLPGPVQEVATISRTPSSLVPGPTFDASTLPEREREQFHRNLRAVELVLAGATQTSVAEKEGIPRSTLGRLVRRTRQFGQIACVPHGSYRRATTLHPAFQECIRRLFLWATNCSAL